MPANTPLNIDFTNSFVSWWMNTVNHTPRCALRAKCTVATDSGTETFYLSHPCAGENMYVDKELIQQPSSEFHLIFNESLDILTVKFFDNAEDCNRTVVKVGVPFPSTVNKGCKITKLEKHLRAFRSVEKLETDKAVYDAMMAQVPINARTTFRMPHRGGSATVTAEYPVTVMNAHHDTHRFQVDTGHLMLPDPRIDENLGIASMREAYIVYNTFDSAEYILRAPVKIKSGAEGIHFTPSIRIACQNELFAAREI